MGSRPIAFFLFIALILGSIIGFLGANSLHPAGPHLSKAFREVTSLPDGEFLEAYPSRMTEMTDDERQIGDKLLIALQAKQKNAPKKASKQEPEEKELPTPAHTKIFVDKAPIQKNFPEGEPSYYEIASQKLPPLQIAAKKLMQLYPDQKFKIKNEENAGVKEGSLENVQTFLNENLCIDPKFSVITEEQKNRSKFFDVVKDDTFKGVTSISSGDKKISMQTTIQFNSAKHNGADYIFTVDAKKNTLEKRAIDSESANEAWRHNSCQSSIVLLSDRCPWNKKFSQEFKDFYVSPDSKKLIGNIYCRNPEDTTWSNIGSFDLNHSAEDAE